MVSFREPASALEEISERQVMADSVEKLGFPGCSLSPQKNDLHNRSVLDDPVPGNIKPIPKNRPKIRYLSFSTESADSTQWGTRRIAAIEKFVVSANVGFPAQGHTHPIGHNRPVESFFNSGH